MQRCLWFWGSFGEISPLYGRAEVENLHKGEERLKHQPNIQLIKPIKLQIIEFSLFAYYSTAWEMQSRGVYQDCGPMRLWEWDVFTLMQLKCLIKYCMKCMGQRESIFSRMFPKTLTVIKTSFKFCLVLVGTLKTYHIPSDSNASSA